MKWGTKSPINTEDSKYGLLLGLRVRGNFSVKITDTRHFISKLVGTVQLDSGFNHNIIWEKFNSLINTKFQSLLMTFMQTNNLSFLGIAAHYNKISTNTFDELKDNFAEYGLELVNFLVESAAPPAEQYEKLRKRKEKLASGIVKVGKKFCRHCGKQLPQEKIAAVRFFICTIVILQLSAYFPLFKITLKIQIRLMLNATIIFPQKKRQFICRK